MADKDLDSLTDGELRRKLLEYGFPVVPITGTTRKVMVKKLRLLMEKEKTVKVPNRRSLAQFSSGEEESDSDDRLVRRNNRRATFGAPASSSTPTTSPMSPPNSTKIKRLPRSALRAAAEKDNETNSDSEPELDSKNNNSVVENDIVETPYLSNFSKRLSHISPRINLDEKVKENDSNGFGYNRPYLPKPKIKEIPQTTKFTNTNKGNYISLILIGCVGLFFLILTILYLGLHSGVNTDLTQLTIPYCTKTINDNCIREKDLQSVLELYKFIKPKLVRTAVDHYCYTPNKSPYMTYSDLVKYVMQASKMEDDTEIAKDLDNLIILANSNPKWEISVLQNREEENLSVSDKVEVLDSIVANMKRNYTTAFIVQDPSLPFGCYFYLKFLFVFKTLVTCVLLILSFWIAKRGVTYYRFHQQQRKDEVILMVEKILDTLQCSEEDQNFVVVNHVRDSLLPIESRKKLAHVWDKAVKYINENESRVRTEVQVVKGETCEVWRWLGGRSTSSPRTKAWQGQAFETQAGAVNSLPCSPTPCLKIRGMVADGDRHLQTIREAVLLKCADKCRILHCSVDLNSKCVYLKCADQNDAAIAYRNLHGWWYASQLVTVKYLRLERYMQRFPDSPVSGPPFLKAH